MEIAYTDEFNRQAAVYFVTDHVADHIQYTESDDSDSMSTCSTRSASTITSSEVSDFRQERFGRMFPLDDNIPAVLPIDGPEHERLEKQHRYMRLLLGSNYFGPFREVMLQTPHPRVLDILTQEGLWVQEVAAEYPHGHFISLDVVPMLPHVPQPNITFEVYDLYAGLAEADNSFDVVHARCCIPTIKNYDMLLREFHRVLRPGGLLLIGELGHDAFEACDTNVPAYASAPQTHRGLAIIREAVSAQGVMLDTVSRIPEWLEPSSSLWTWSDVDQDPRLSPLLGQPRQTSRRGDSRRGFRGIMERVAHIPNGVWPADPVLREVGALAQSVWKETWLAMVPLLLEYKISRDEVRLILAGAIKELCDPSVRTVWKYHMIHCFKI